MKADRLLAHYERIADTPEAIPRLRRFILDLAVRGKLVEQHPQDEPASELLKRITKKKARMVKTGTIKLRKINAREREEPLDLAVPTGWELTELGVIAEKITDGAHKTPTYVEEGVPFVSVKDFSGGTLDLSSTRFIPPSEHKVLYQRCDPRRGDILIARIGTLGKAVLVDTDLEFSLFVSVGLVRFDHQCVNPEFLRFVLNSPFVESEFDRIKIGGGTHTNKLNLGDLHTVALLLPPIAEQRCIVAKVHELMVLCDRLCGARTKQETTRNRLATASLARLNAPHLDPDTFQNHAAFALENLTRLTIRPDQITALRQTILNLAIRGKLVEQDANDEPASELLRQIAAERARLVANKSIKSRRATKSAIPSDIEFTLPIGWSPANVEQILIEIQTGPFGSSLHQSDYQLGGVPVINPASIQNERLVPFDKMAVGPATLARLSSFQLHTDDIVMGRRGEMGRCAVVTERERGWLCGTGSLVLRPFKCIYPRFLSMLIGSPFSRRYLRGTAVGTTMQNLNQKICSICLSDSHPAPNSIELSPRLTN